MANTEMTWSDFSSAASLPFGILKGIGKLAFRGIKAANERTKIREMKEELLQKGWTLESAKRAWLADEINDDQYQFLKAIFSADV